MKYPIKRYFCPNPITAQEICEHERKKGHKVECFRHEPGPFGEWFFSPSNNTFIVDVGYA